MNLWPQLTLTDRVRKVDTIGLVAFANSSHPGPDDAERCTLPGAAQQLASGSLPSVVVVAAVPGGTGHGVRDALRHAPAGIVLQAIGIGNASVQDAAAVGDAVASGVPVLVTSRVQRGAVQPVYGNGGGKALEQAGALFAGQLSTWQTRVLLSVCLALSPGMPETQEAAATWLTQHAASR